MQKLSVKIDGIHCDSCIKIITMGLQELEGIKKVNINQQSKIGEVEFDETKTTQEEILENIKNSGYTAVTV